MERARQFDIDRVRRIMQGDRAIAARSISVVVDTTTDDNSPSTSGQQTTAIRPILKRQLGHVKLSPTTTADASVPPTAAAVVEALVEDVG